MLSVIGKIKYEAKLIVKKVERTVQEQDKVKKTILQIARWCKAHIRVVNKKLS